MSRVETCSAARVTVAKVIRLADAVFNSVHELHVRETRRRQRERDEYKALPWYRKVFAHNPDDLGIFGGLLYDDGTEPALRVARRVRDLAKASADDFVSVSADDYAVLVDWSGS